MSIEWLLTKTQNTEVQKKASESVHQQMGSSHTVRNPQPARQPAGGSAEPSEETNSRQQKRKPQKEHPSNGRIKTRKGILGFLLGRFS
jgi:hypothetical protein